MADYSKLTKKELKEQIYLYKDTIYKQNRIYNMLLSDYKTLKDKLLEYGKGIVSDCCIKTNTDIYQENQQLKQQLAESETQLKEEIEEKNGVIRALSACNRQNDEFADMIKKLVNEEEELKQQLHDLPKKIVEEIRKWGQKHYNWVGDGTGYDGQDYNECIGFNMAIDQLNEILDTILKKYGGEDE